MRSAVILAAIIGVVGAMTAPSIAEAGELQKSVALHVTTHVDGAPSPGTVVQVDCTPAGSVLPTSVRLGFDAQGRATVVAGDTEGWEIIPADFSWIFSVSEFPEQRTTCRLEQVDPGGASEVAWTCADGQFGGQLVLGCSEHSGGGSGPVTVSIGATADEVDVQSISVTFTNTFATKPVVVTPTFTGWMQHAGEYLGPRSGIRSAERPGLR